MKSGSLHYNTINMLDCRKPVNNFRNMLYFISHAASRAFMIFFFLDRYFEDLASGRHRFRKHGWKSKGGKVSTDRSCLKTCLLLCAPNRQDGYLWDGHLFPKSFAYFTEKLEEVIARGHVFSGRFLFICQFRFPLE